MKHGSPLTELPGIGPVVAAQLVQVGIDTPEALIQAGSERAWLMIQGIDPTACINRLLALEGAIRGVRKADLPSDVHAALRAFYQAHKIPGALGGRS